MPIRINERMPVVRLLEREQIFIMPESRAASQDIRELEKEMGLVLFNRTGRGTTLTAEESAFLPYARSVLAQYQEECSPAAFAGLRGSVL